MARTSFERSRRWVSGLCVVAFVVVALLNAPPERPAMNEAMEIVGFALLIVAMLGRIWAALYLSGRKSKVLCTAGPYAITRNPLYFFSFLAAAGLGLLTESVTLTVAVVAAFLIYYGFVIRHEEGRLAELFGAAFDEYRHRVPRLFPRRLPIRDPSPEMTVQTRSFLRGVRDTSVFLWIFFVFEVAEALTKGFGWALPTAWRLP